MGVGDIWLLMMRQQVDSIVLHLFKSLMRRGLPLMYLSIWSNSGFLRIASMFSSGSQSRKMTISVSFFPWSLWKHSDKNVSIAVKLESPRRRKCCLSGSPLYWMLPNAEVSEDIFCSSVTLPGSTTRRAMKKMMKKIWPALV